MSARGRQHQHAALDCSRAPRDLSRSMFAGRERLLSPCLTFLGALAKVKFQGRPVGRSEIRIRLLWVVKPLSAFSAGRQVCVQGLPLVSGSAG